MTYSMLDLEKNRDSALMFSELCIETIGSCNRTCPTCMRNSYPDRPKVASRFGKPLRLDTDLVYSIIDQAVEMGYTGGVNLQHFNEPLQDPRIADFCKYAKEKGVFEYVRFHSNADLLTERRAKELDGNVDAIQFALYDEIGGRPLEPGQRPDREAWIRSLFSKTEINFTGGDHIVTHYSPLPQLRSLIENSRGKPCIFDVRVRFIIDFRGEMLLCCDDIEGLWDLGNAHDKTLEELWWSDKHVEIMKILGEPGGRYEYSFCLECPRA